MDSEVTASMRLVMGLRAVLCEILSKSISNTKYRIVFYILNKSICHWA